jgi:hypothetical protein
VARCDIVVPLEAFPELIAKLNALLDPVVAVHQEMRGGR